MSGRGQQASPTLHPRGPASRLPRYGSLAFAVALWAFATLALGGRLGRVTDDHTFDLRDPVTGVPPSVWRFDPWTDEPYFWRPIHQVYLFAVRTYLPDQDRLIHIVVAAIHGLVCLLLYRLVSRLTANTRLAITTAILFLVLPLNYEVALWLCTTSTAIGSALFLWLCLAMTRWARGPTTTPSWWQVVPMSVIAFSIPWFYEQPGAAVASLPVLYMAARPRAQRFMTAARRAIGAGVVLGLTQLVFAVAMVRSLPESGRGGAGTLIRLSEVPDRFRQVLDQIRAQVFGEPGRALLSGSWHAGLDAVTAGVTWVWIPAVIAVVLAWMLLIAVDRRESDLAPALEAPDVLPVRPAWIALLGLLILGLALLPVFAVRGHPISPRMLYVPGLGAFLAASGLASAAARLAPRLFESRGLRVCGVAVLSITSVLAAVCMVGLQRTYQKRAELDGRQVSRLASLVPNPPHDAVFVPLRIESRVWHTGRPAFDLLIPGIFETTWSGPAALRRELKRRDVFASSRNPWAGPEVYHTDAESLSLLPRAIEHAPFPRDQFGCTEIPWSICIPFVIDRNDRVRLVREITVWFEDGRTLTVNVPTVNDMLTNGEIRAEQTRRFILSVASPVPGGRGGVQPLTGWKWVRDDTPISTSNILPWRDTDGAIRTAVWMHPTAESGRRSAMSIQIPASSSPRRLTLRATMTERDLSDPESAGPIDIAVLWNDGPVIVRQTLEPKAIRNQMAWSVLSLEIPPTTSPRHLTVRVTSASGKAAHETRRVPPCWVTTGSIAALDAD